jgi:hypothetical protein
LKALNRLAILFDEFEDFKKDAEFLKNLCSFYNKLKRDFYFLIDSTN